MQLCDLTNAVPSLAIADHRITIDDELGPAAVLAFESGAPHARAHSFDD
ncbi:MAG: hypothetical protein WBQ49_17775 [Rhodomicrobium sp.]